MVSVHALARSSLPSLAGTPGDNSAADPEGLGIGYFRRLVLDRRRAVSHDRCSTALPSDPFGFSRAERPHLREDTAQDRCLVLQPGCGQLARG
jgi:hypothetical protein